MFSGPGIIGVKFLPGPVSFELAVWICNYWGRKKDTRMRVEILDILVNVGNSAGNTLKCSHCLMLPMLILPCRGDEPTC